VAVEFVRLGDRLSSRLEDTDRRRRPRSGLRARRMRNDGSKREPEQKDAGTSRFCGHPPKLAPPLPTASADARIRPNRAGAGNRGKMILASGSRGEICPPMPLKEQPFKRLITKNRPNAAQVIPPSFDEFNGVSEMQVLGKRGE